MRTANPTTARVHADHFSRTQWAPVSRGAVTCTRIATRDDPFRTIQRTVYRLWTELMKQPRRSPPRWRARQKSLLVNAARNRRYSLRYRPNDSEYQTVSDSPGTRRDAA